MDLTTAMVHPFTTLLSQAYTKDYNLYRIINTKLKLTLDYRKTSAPLSTPKTNFEGTSRASIIERHTQIGWCVSRKTALGKQKYFVSIISKIYNMNNGPREELNFGLNKTMLYYLCFSIGLNRPLNFLIKKSSIVTGE